MGAVISRSEGTVSGYIPLSRPAPIAKLLKQDLAKSPSASHLLGCLQIGNTSCISQVQYESHLVISIQDKSRCQIVMDQTSAMGTGQDSSLNALLWDHVFCLVLL